MTRSDWTNVYAGYWDKIWGSKDPKPQDGEYYQRQLLHPFFRLDFAIGYDISDALTLVEQRSTSTPRDSFDEYLEEICYDEDNVLYLLDIPFWGLILGRPSRGISN